MEFFSRLVDKICGKIAQHQTAPLAASFSKNPLFTSKTAAVASNSLENTFAVARAHLESLRGHLLPQLQSLLPRQSAVPPNFLARPLHRLHLAPELLFSILIPALLILLFFMASWRSYLGGRYSPFATPTSRPTVTENDYHYLGPDDIVDPPQHNSTNYFPPSRHGASRADAEDPLAPDILVLKHRGTTYPLHFPAFSIGEGYLRVGELRKYAAKETGTADPRRIKLLYKGKILKDDAAACCEEGLKQNSELMCVVETPVPAHARSDTSESADDSEMERADSRGPRVDVDGSLIGAPPRKRKNHRSGGKSKGKKGGRDDGDDYDDKKPGQYSGPSQAPPMHFNAAGAAPPPPRPTTATPQPPTGSVPKGPMEKLDEVADVFHSRFVPMCVAFMKSPPADARVKHTEYMKLSESILSQIIFKLDGVETDGNEEARAKRKALVKETQAMLTRLDEVGKNR